MVAVDAHGFGQNDDISDLADFGRLDVERQKGEVQPASVAGGAFNTPDQQHGDKNRVEQEEKRPLPGQNVDVQCGHAEIDENSRAEGRRLDDDHAGVAFRIGGGVDHDDAENGGGDAQRQQDHIALFENFQQTICKFLHDLTSVLIILPSFARLVNKKVRRRKCLQKAAGMIQ